MAPAELSLTVWVLLAVAAALVGFAKTAIGGAGALAVVIFAAALPTRASTGALLPLLLVGDLVAVAVYRRHASLSTLLRLLPGVLPGFCSVPGWSPWSTTAPCGRRSAWCCWR